MFNVEDIQAAEQYVEDLLKLEPALAHHLKTLRAVAPDSARFIAQKMFTDPMVEGVGNKAAYEDFLSRPRDGVHVMMDGNDFGRINKEWGQTAGDGAIKAMGAALSRASRNNRGKLFRVGGDEFRAHFETPEQAHSFLRHAREELEGLPPVKGQHHHSVSIGIGQTPDHAEQALIHAKNAKKLAGYAPGHAQTHAHSLLEGAAGPVPVTRSPEIPPSIRKPIQPGQSPLAMPSAAGLTPVPTQKSEQDEFARMRFEARLIKMAVIHDNPQQPMKVWRVQNEAGDGPYEGGPKEADFEDRNEFLDAKSQHEGVLENIRMNAANPQPLPEEDFHQAELLGMVGRRFGFGSQRSAESWFSGEDLAELRHRGFTLRQVLARKVWASKSGRQVMFEPHQP